MRLIWIHKNHTHETQQELVGVILTLTSLSKPQNVANTCVLSLNINYYICHIAQDLFTSLIQYFFALFAIQLYYVLCVELLVFVARLVYSRKCVL